MRGLSIPSTNFSTAIPYSHSLPTLSTMNTSPTGNVGLRLLGPCQHGMSNTRTDHRMTNTNYGHSNSNVGNFSYSYNNTINVGMEERSSRIQEWLSPLEPHKRHRDVRNSPLPGVVTSKRTSVLTYAVETTGQASLRLPRQIGRAHV